MSCEAAAHNFGDIVPIALVFAVQECKQEQTLICFAPFDHIDIA